MDLIGFEPFYSKCANPPHQYVLKSKYMKVPIYQNYSMCIMYEAKY